MNKTQISNLIRYKTGKTVDEIATLWGYSKATVYRAISGQLGKSPLYQVIADTTGKPLSELWPNKFQEN